MRIISGTYKGRRINAPKKLPVRPTTDMAKEALFNILNNLYYFDDISVLDLFAGTGNISYEFSKIPELVFNNQLLEDSGLLIIEHSKHTNLSEFPNFSYSKSYGGNVFSFFEAP